MKKILHRHYLFFLAVLICAAHKLSASETGFTENKGQITNQDKIPNSDVLYMYKGKGINILLRKSGYSYEFYSVNNLAVLPAGKKSPTDYKAFNSTTISYNRVDIDFEEINSNTKIHAENQLQSTENFFISGKAVKDVHAFRKITYTNIYPKTDIEFLINQDERIPLKYNIILHPGADISKVKFLLRGGSLIKNDNGSLTISTAIGSLEENIPFSFYTDTPSENTKIEFGTSGNHISFSGAYDTSKTLVIDPSTNLIWGTYFGGPSYDFCTSSGRDASNNIYIAGYTLSSSNIATTAAYQTTLAGSYDAYLAKFDSNGALLWSTYFGSSGFDIFYTLYITSSGTIYAAGDCDSSTGVATPGAHQTIYGGGIDDALITRFSTNGQLQWSTYYGGSDHDIIVTMTPDNNGNIVVAGHTQSPNNISTPGVYNPNFAAGYDVLLAKFDSLGARVWGTYYGDTGTEEALSVECDASNNIYTSGFTTSLFGIATGGGHQTVSGGSQDGFIAKFDAAGANLLWGTYYGGGGNDQATALGLDNTGKLFVAGITTSSNNIASAGAYQSSLSSADDSFLSAFTSAGTNLWGTYFGGNDVDYINDLVLDPANNLIFCGSTMSSNSISTANAYQPALAAINYYDAFVSKFSPSGFPKLGTYYGGNDNDNARSITLDNTGKIYLAGETSSSVSIASPAATCTNYGGLGDSFLAKFCLAPEPLITPAGVATCVYNGFTLTAQSGFSSYLWSDSSTSNPLIIPGTGPAGTFYFTVMATDGFGCEGVSDTATVILYTCLGVEELQRASLINLYPVPAHNQLNIELPGTSFEALEIYSASGQSVLQQKTSSPAIDISQLTPGVYFIRVYNGDSVYQRKFIKE